MVEKAGLGAVVVAVALTMVIQQGEQLHSLAQLKQPLVLLLRNTVMQAAQVVITPTVQVGEEVQVGQAYILQPAKAAQADRAQRRQ
jgi:hypothetical protein